MRPLFYLASLSRKFIPQCYACQDAMAVRAKDFTFFKLANKSPETYFVGTNKNGDALFFRCWVTMVTLHDTIILIPTLCAAKEFQIRPEKSSKTGNMFGIVLPGGR